MTDTTETDVVETPAPDANAPVEQTAETPEVSQDVSDSSPDAADESDSSDKPKGGIQKRISELTRNWRETEREAARKAAEADYWREIALRNTPAMPDTQNEPAQPAAPEPVKTLADFNYDEPAYQRYVFDEAAKAARAAATDVVKQERQRESAERTQQTFSQRLADFSKATPDFDAVVRNPAVPITKQIVELVSALEDAPAILYYLGKNPETTVRIAHADPVTAARELGKVEARIAFEREQVRKPVVPPKPAVSQAPPPPPTIEATEPATTVDPDELPIDKWMEMENKRQAKRIDQMRKASGFRK